MLAEDQIKRELERIAAQHGGILNPAAVVEAAGSPDSILHEQFDWNDSTAAHAFRLEQARRLIRSVRVVVTTDKRTISTVYYVRNPEAEAHEAGYVALPHLMSERALAAAAIAQEFDRALANLIRASELAAALGIEEPIADILARLRVLASRVAGLRAA